MLEDRIHHSYQPRNKQNDQGMQQEILMMGLKSHFCAVLGNLPEMWLLNQCFGRGEGMDLRSWVVGLCWLRKAETWLCRGDLCGANSPHIPEHKPCHRLSSALMVKLDRNTRFTGKEGERMTAATSSISRALLPELSTFFLIFYAVLGGGTGACSRRLHLTMGWRHAPSCLLCSLVILRRFPMLS